MSIGSKIAAARKKQNLTQEQLAELLGVTRQSVSRWESDAVYPETDKIIKLAEILNVNCDYLLKEDSPENGKPTSTSLITRLLKSTLGKRVKIELYDDDYDFSSHECRILDFDGNWANIEVSKGKVTENKLIPVASIASVTFVKAKE